MTAEVIVFLHVSSNLFSLQDILPPNTREGSYKSTNRKLLTHDVRHYAQMESYNVAQFVSQLPFWN